MRSFAPWFDGELHVRVADTGVGFQAASGSGIGLANIRSRLAALYGQGASLQLESNQPTGVVAAITVPLVALDRTPKQAAGAWTVQPRAAA